MKLLSAVAILIASAIALTISGAGAAGDGELYIAPQSSYVAPNQSFNIDLVAVPPDDSLAAWVVRVHYDPNVIQFQACSSVPVPPVYVGVSDCGMSILGPDEAAVSVGAFLDPDTELGLTATTVLMTANFEAIGAVPDSTDLEIEVIDFLGPDPNAPSFSPALTDGYVEITNDPATPTPTSSPPPSATAIPIGGTVTVATAPPTSSSQHPISVAATAALLVATALAAIRLTRRLRP